MRFWELQRLNVEPCNFEPLELRRCPDGEIGRRTAFRWQRSQGCAGSNPVLGTSNYLKPFLALAIEGFLFLGDDTGDGR